MVHKKNKYNEHIIKIRTQEKQVLNFKVLIRKYKVKLEMKSMCVFLLADLINS